MTDANVSAIRQRWENGPSFPSYRRGYLSAKSDIRALLASDAAKQAEIARLRDEIERRAAENAALQDRQLALGHGLVAIANHVARLAGEGHPNG